MFTTKSAVPLAKNPERAVALALEEGLSLIGIGLSDREVQKRFEQTIHPLGETVVPSSEVLGAFPALSYLQVVLRELNMTNEFDARIINFDLGAVVPPHVDYEGALEGVSLLVPIYHRAEITRHDEKGKILNESVYGPGEVLLIRQNSGDKSPARHSSEVIQRRRDVGFPQRTLITLDPVSY